MNNEKLKLSIIIPTLNEEEMLGKLLPELKARCREEHLAEIIISDAGSKDGTKKVAEKYELKWLDSSQKGRSAQMNYGAEHAGGDILYFVHADTVPPCDFSSSILRAFDNGHQAGCFMSKFDIAHWFLRIGNYLSFLPFWFCRGGGQTLFISKKLFIAIGRYDESMQLMEEYDLIKRIKKHTKFRVIRRFAITSGRDYIKYGPLHLQFTYIRVFRMYAKGATQEQLMAYIKQKLDK